MGLVRDTPTSSPVTAPSTIPPPSQNGDAEAHHRTDGLGPSENNGVPTGADGKEKDKPPVATSTPSTLLPKVDENGTHASTSARADGPERHFSVSVRDRLKAAVRNGLT